MTSSFPAETSLVILARPSISLTPVSNCRATGATSLNFGPDTVSSIWEGTDALVTAATANCTSSDRGKAARTCSSRSAGNSTGRLTVKVANSNPVALAPGPLAIRGAPRATWYAATAPSCIKRSRTSSTWLTSAKVRVIPVPAGSSRSIWI